MIKFWIVIAVLALEAHYSFSQSITTPQAIPYTMGGYMKISSTWSPNARFLKANPNFSKDGSFSFTEIDYWNSKNYPAKFFSNDFKLDIPGKAIVVFSGDELQDINGTPNDKQPDKMPELPLYKLDDTDIPCLGNVIFSNEGLYNIIDNRTAYSGLYHQFNSAYSRKTDSLFRKKNATAVIAPFASLNLSSYEIKPDVIIFEFSIDDIKDEGRKVASGAAVFNAAVLYKLNVRDCAGNIIKTYGQTVFVNLQPGKNYSSYSKYSNSVLLGHTYQTAMESLLNQFTKDDEAKNNIRSRVILNKIKATQGSDFITAFVNKNVANHYRQCQLNLIVELQILNKEIVRKGGSPLNFSGLQIPQNKSPYVSAATYGTAVTFVASAAGLLTVIANEKKESDIKELKAKADQLMANCKRFQEKENNGVEGFNKIVTSDNNNSVSGISGEITYSREIDTENFWTSDQQNNSSPVQSTENYNSQENDFPIQNTNIQDNVSSNYNPNQNNDGLYQQTSPPPQQESYSDKFWDHNNKDISSDNQVKNNFSQTGTISSSTDLENSAARIHGSINQNAGKAVSNLKTATNATLDWTNGIINSAIADMQAATAKQGYTAPTNGRGEINAAAANECPELKRNFNMQAEIDRCTGGKSYGNATTQSCLERAQAKLARVTIQYCRDKLTQEQITKLEQVATHCDNVAKSLEGK